MTMEPEKQEQVKAQSEINPAERLVRNAVAGVSDIEPAADSASEVEMEQAAVPRRSKVRSTVPSVGVQLAVESSGIASLKPVTVGQVFQETCAKYPNRQALFYKEGGEWQAVTFAQYYANCLKAAKSFRKLGLETCKGVAIIGFNSPEWFYSSIGSVFAGGLSAGMYTSNSPDACRFIANDCKANIVVVENKSQLEKILHIRDRLPGLKAVVQYKGKLSQQYDDVYDWEQFMELGQDVEDGVIEDSIKALKPEQCAVLVYTSGTTGNPKGVMLSHDNLTWTCARILANDPSTWNRDEPTKVISYLPLSHVGGQIIDVFLTLSVAGSVYFAQPDALKGSLALTIKEVKPTFFFGVSRLYQKLMEGMQSGHDKAKERVGFSEARKLASGGSPLDTVIVEYFMKYNMPVLQSFGMSESSAVGSESRIDNWKPGSVGRAPIGTKIKLDNTDETGEGEICIYGRHVFMGYLNNEEKTLEAIDDEGWLHSGDLGRMDSDGFLYITGRIKELLLLSRGATKCNIAPVPIEDRIKVCVPFLSNVMVTGEGRDYLSCLVTLKCTIDPTTGGPQDELQPQVLNAMAELGCWFTRPSEIAQHKVEGVLKHIQEGLDKVNQEALSDFHEVQKFTLLESDFSVRGEELGPTLKLRRGVVEKKYAHLISTMYEDER